MKRAGIHQLKGKIFVQGFSTTTEGMYCLHGSVFGAGETDYKEIGDCVLKAFNECKTGIPHHVEWRDGPMKSEMLEATQCKTWNALMKSSKSIKVYENDEGSITILPAKFGGVSGPNKGYRDLKDKAIKSSFDPDELGKNVIKALELCE